MFYRIPILVCIGLFFITSCSQDSSKHETHKVQENYYTCPMHPQIHEDGPGKCPICHMNLTKVIVEEEASDPIETDKVQTQVSPKEIWQCKDYPDVTSEVEELCPLDGSKMILVSKDNPPTSIISKVKLRSSQLKHLNLSVMPASKKDLKKTIRLLGQVLSSEDNRSSIPARIGGRVEKVYVRSVGSLVTEGAPVVDFYSPGLITAGEEYLLSRKNYERTKRAALKELVEQTKQRLELWGVRPNQYQKWYKDQSVPKAITLYSPVTGIVTKLAAAVGQYFKEGSNLFELTDLSQVWVEMDVYEQDAGLVGTGQKVKLNFTALPSQQISSQVDFIYPTLNSDSRTLKIRTTIDNPKGRLRPGMVAQAYLELPVAIDALVVPRSAIVDTGIRKVVWREINTKQYESIEVQTGHEAQGLVEVTQGIMPGERIVIDGNFLLDAQSQLFGGHH